MKRLYEKFFYIPKHGKIRESVMLARVTTTVIISLMCLAAMGFTAYAYFSYNVISPSNVIQSAKFETALAVEVMPNSGARSGEVPTVNTSEGKHTVSLSPDALYKITLSRSKDCTAETGYLIITANGCDGRYHTQQLGADGDKTTQEISFFISVDNATTVVFEERWGTSSYYYDYKENGDTNTLYVSEGETVAIAVPPSGENPLSEKTQTDMNTPNAESDSPETENNSAVSSSEPSAEDIPS